MLAKELKEICKDNGLKVSGKKADLKERIIEHHRKEAREEAQRAAGVNATPPEDATPSPEDDYESMTAEDLKHALRSRGLSVRGKRETLIKRLREDSETIKEFLKISPEVKMDALARVQAAALREYLKDKKSADKTRKFVNVTIKSLELEPEKYTAGGAPSVTADVLRKLAGEPFADPPKYGSVSSPDRQKCVVRFAVVLRY